MRVLAFDPGATTGYAVMARASRGLVLEAAGTFIYRREQTGNDIWDAIRRHSPILIVVEDWENQGKQVDMHSIWPNRIIGQVEAYANLLGIHIARVGASLWKPSFSASAGLLKMPLPVRLEAKQRGVAQRLRLELGSWPAALYDMSDDTLRHAVDAAGLACWMMLTSGRNGYAAVD